jgi:hypothetical protein
MGSDRPKPITITEQMRQTVAAEIADALWRDCYPSGQSRCPNQTVVNKVVNQRIDQASQQYPGLSSDLIAQDLDKLVIAQRDLWLNEMGADVWLVPNLLKELQNSPQFQFAADVHNAIDARSDTRLTLKEPGI